MWRDALMLMVARKKSLSSMVSSAHKHGEFHIFIFVIFFKKIHLRFSYLISIKWD